LGTRERLFRKVVLESDGLKDGVVEPAIQEAYCSGVAGKDFGGEGIDWYIGILIVSRFFS
jgi:hypothetical protein